MKEAAYRRRTSGRSGSGNRNVVRECVVEIVGGVGRVDSDRASGNIFADFMCAKRFESANHFARKVVVTRLFAEKFVEKTHVDSLADRIAVGRVSGKRGGSQARVAARKIGHYSLQESESQRR